MIGYKAHVNIEENWAQAAAWQAALGKAS